MGTDALDKRLTSALAKVKAYYELGVSVLLTPEEVSALLNVSRGTLSNWRCRSEGPRFVKVGRRKVRYPVESLLSWLEENQRYGGRLSDAFPHEQTGDD